MGNLSLPHHLESEVGKVGKPASNHHPHHHFLVGCGVVVRITLTSRGEVRKLQPLQGSKIQPSRSHHVH